MAKRTIHLPILAHWETSDDPLLKALAGTGSKLYSAIEAVHGQVRKGPRGALGIWLRDTRVTDAGLEALAGQTHVQEFESSPHLTDAGLRHLKDMTEMERLMLGRVRITGDGLKYLAGMAKLR